MNNLPLSKKTLILSHLVEGISVRSIERLTGVHRDTILRLQLEAGTKAQDILDSQLVNLKSNFVQIDEIWTYVSKKQKNLSMENFDIGDQYVFVAIDSETNSYRFSCRETTIFTRIFNDERTTNPHFKPLSTFLRCLHSIL